MLITTKLKYLEALAIIAAKQDVRYYLQGVAINQSHLVATDGHKLAAIPLVNPAPELELIIPTDAIKAACKSTSVKVRKDVNVTIDTDAHTLTVGTMGATVPFVPVDGRFPQQWKDILATHTAPVDHGLFNWQYMADFQKMAVILTGKKNASVEMIPNGGNAARVNILGFP